MVNPKNAPEPEAHFHAWHGSSEPGRPVRRLTRDDTPFRTRQAAHKKSYGRVQMLLVLKCQDPLCQHHPWMKKD